MTTPLKIVVEKHSDGYVAYPLGLARGTVVGEGDTYEAALADVRSAIAFHVETFGQAALEPAGDDPVLEALWPKPPFQPENLIPHPIVAKFPVDAPCERVLHAPHALGFEVVRSGNHVSLARTEADGTITPMTLPGHRAIKGSTLRTGADSERHRSRCVPSRV